MLGRPFNSFIVSITTDSHLVGRFDFEFSCFFMPEPVDIALAGFAGLGLPVTILQLLIVWGKWRSKLNPTERRGFLDKTKFHVLVQVSSTHLPMTLKRDRTLTENSSCVFSFYLLGW